MNFPDDFNTELNMTRIKTFECESWYVGYTLNEGPIVRQHSSNRACSSMTQLCSFSPSLEQKLLPARGQTRFSSRQKKEMKIT